MGVFAWIVVALIILIFLAYLHEDKKYLDQNLVNGVVHKKIPGMQPSDPEDGNMPDILKAKTMSLFLRQLHKQYGPIASFWEGRQYSVSVASPKYLKPQRHLFDIPDHINEPFRVIVQDDSIGLLNGEEVKRRRQLYDQHFMFKACKTYSETFLKIAREYVEKWTKFTSNDHIPMSKSILTASIKAIIKTTYGDYLNEDEILDFQKKTDWVNNFLENPPLPGSDEEKKLNQFCEDLRSTSKKLLELRKTDKSEEKKSTFADVLLRNDVTEKQRISDGMTFLFTGYETVARTIMCALYECCKSPPIQEKIHDEINEILGDNPVTNENVNKLTYLRQVINESMRLHSSAEYTGRKNDTELQLGEYVVPPNTHIYHALAVINEDPDIWNEPEKFDPDRFSPENSKTRDPYAFKPFGFAGKRQCPGQFFALAQATIFLSEWIRNFRFRLVPEQKFTLFQGVIPRFEEEIWVTVKQRKKCSEL